MSTYLLTWNPENYDWENEGNYRQMIAQIKNGESPLSDWSCGNTKSIQHGDRIFLLRQGAKQPGMVGSGRVTRELHRVKANSDWPWQVEVSWDTILPIDAILSRENLLAGILPASLVNAQKSGCIIDDASAAKLEQEWKRHIKRPEPLAAIARGFYAANEGETTEQKLFIRKRDRKLRDTALNESKGVCAVCEVDFSKRLEGKALRVLQVHHKKQLGWSDTKPKLNKPSDLVVVCANCHLLLHLNPKKSMAISTLKKWMKARW